MDKPYRRYEVLLPLRFNDGNPVPDELLAETILELEQQFGAVSCETQNIRGIWSHEGQSYRDDLVRLVLVYRLKHLYTAFSRQKPLLREERVKFSTAFESDDYSVLKKMP